MDAVQRRDVGARRPRGGSDRGRRVPACRGRPPARPAPADRRSALGVRRGRGRADDAAALARRRVPAGDRRELPGRARDRRGRRRGVDRDRRLRPSACVGSFGLQRDPATGGFDLAPLRQATEIVVDGRPRRHRPARRGASRSTPGATIGQVSEAVDQFDEMLTTAEGTIPQLNARTRRRRRAARHRRSEERRARLPEQRGGGGARWRSRLADAPRRRQRHGQHRPPGVERRLPRRPSPSMSPSTRARSSCTTRSSSTT